MNTATPSAAAHGVRWDLSALFASPTDPKISAAWDTAHSRADAFVAQYKGKVDALAAPALAQAIREIESLQNEAAKPIIYAHLLFAADTSDPALGAFLQDQTERSSGLRVKLMFFDIEVQKIDASRAETLFAEPDLAEYRHYLDVVRAYTPHMLSESEEVLLEECANVGSRAWVRLHDELTANYEYTYTDPGTGETSVMTEQEVLENLRHTDRAVRTAAADAFSTGLGSMQRVITYVYNTLLADKKLEDRLRRFDAAEDSRHLSNELDKPTVDVVMRLCRERSDLVERYYKVKREVLGLPSLTHVDRYAPLNDTKQQVPWEKAREMVVDAFGSFHPEMAARADEFFAKNWIEAEPRAGKTGGAFCSYLTPDLHPVVLMSYLGSLENVETLAHELGHGVHASLSRAQSPFNYHGTLPLAELASIFGEMIVFEKLTAQADARDKLALYAGKIEGIFATVHRQAAMFRFEQRSHQARRELGELTAEQFGDIWQEELQSMFGSGLTLGEQHRTWWMYVGHFFHTPFYVYAYSFGELLTLSVYELAKQGGPDFAAKYLDVLRLGGSKTPQELMGVLGVDLRSEAFWQAGFAAIDRLVTTFEGLWSDLKGA
ncbi:MAG: M3 family oligoendopeptidase [Fimbriimonadaceae bacterium]|nr:M3 family oligoendopeptidase [Fimbriimonadaceae bacterium]